jgi:hypothetical protein
MSPVNPGLLSNSPEQFTRLKVLLVEPDLEVLANRTLVLSRSNYAVAPANNYREIFSLHDEIGFCLAVLNDTLGEMALRAAAEFVRRQWPSARILILGNAQAALEDYLYDEVVNHRIRSEELLDTLERLSKDDWSLRSRLVGSRLRSDCIDERLTARRSTPSESDPRKQITTNLSRRGEEHPQERKEMRR